MRKIEAGDPGLPTRGKLIVAGLAWPVAWHYSSGMSNNHSPGPLRLAISALVGVGMLAGTAYADDSSTQKGALPGVTRDYRIAKPAPEPEPDDALPASGNGQFKIGGTDVRISGSITIDVGAGAIKPSNR